MKPLARLTKLESLHLQDTLIRILAPLAGLTSLRSLDLKGTKISNLAPLAGLTNLRSLDLQGTQVAGTEIATLKATLPHLQILTYARLTAMTTPEVSRDRG